MWFQKTYLSATSKKRAAREMGYGHYLSSLSQSFLVSLDDDLYNNEVIAYKLSTRNDIRLVLDSLSNSC
jgi:hypothetical protein